MTQSILNLIFGIKYIKWSKIMIPIWMSQPHILEKDYSHTRKSLCLISDSFKKGHSPALQKLSSSPSQTLKHGSCVAFYLCLCSLVSFWNQLPQATGVHLPMYPMFPSAQDSGLQTLGSQDSIILYKNIDDSPKHLFIALFTNICHIRN